MPSADGLPAVNPVCPLAVHADCPFAAVHCVCAIGGSPISRCIRGGPSNESICGGPFGRPTRRSRCSPPVRGSPSSRSIRDSRCSHSIRGTPSSLCIRGNVISRSIVLAAFQTVSLFAAVHPPSPDSPALHPPARTQISGCLTTANRIESPIAPGPIARQNPACLTASLPHCLPACSFVDARALEAKPTRCTAREPGATSNGRRASRRALQPSGVFLADAECRATLSGLTSRAARGSSQHWAQRRPSHATSYTS